MRTGPKQFINPQMRAPNVLEVDIPPGLIDSLKDVVRQVQAIRIKSGDVVLDGGLTLHVTGPEGWDSDIRWISQADEAGYGFFEPLFRQSGVTDAVAEFIDYDRQIRLYSGFFVSRSLCSKPRFHADWVKGDNDAFTLIAPLTENCAGMGLVYRDITGREVDYPYRLGKGIVFGDHFVHATQAGRTSEPAVLLSFSFGTDRMENWPAISHTAAHQGICHRRPDGVFVRTEYQPGDDA
ncbi:hypothetical protein BH11PSE2_BH11PSE2_16090 [soil metagenome]